MGKPPIHRDCSLVWNLILPQEPQIQWEDLSRNLKGGRSAPLDLKGPEAGGSGFFALGARRIEEYLGYDFLLERAARILFRRYVAGSLLRRYVPGKACWTLAQAQHAKHAFAAPARKLQLFGASRVAAKRVAGCGLGLGM